MAEINDPELAKMVSEEYRLMIDKYTQTNAELDLFLRRFEAKYRAKMDALAADDVIIEARNDGVLPVPAGEILSFVAILDGLKSAMPAGSTDAFIARRVRPLRIAD